MTSAARATRFDLKCDLWSAEMVFVRLSGGVASMPGCGLLVLKSRMIGVQQHQLNGFPTHNARIIALGCCWRTALALTSA